MRISPTEIVVRFPKSLQQALGFLCLVWTALVLSVSVAAAQSAATSCVRPGTRQATNNPISSESNAQGLSEAQGEAILSELRQIRQLLERLKLRAAFPAAPPDK